MPISKRWRAVIQLADGNEIKVEELESEEVAKLIGRRTIKHGVTSRFDELYTETDGSVLADAVVAYPPHEVKRVIIQKYEKEEEIEKS